MYPLIKNKQPIAWAEVLDGVKVAVIITTAIVISGWAN